MRRIVVLMAVLGTLPATTSSCAFLFPYQPDYLCETRVRALCHFAFSCCNPNERSVLGFASAYRTEDDCVEDTLDNGSQCLSGQAVKESVDEGRFEYDIALAQKCNQPLIDALNSCDSEKVFDEDALDLDSDCEDVVFPDAYGQGLVKDGDECFADYECKDAGGDCFIEPETDPDKRHVTAVGECKAPAKKGEDCSEDLLCEPGTLCDGTECVELKKNGDPCLDGFECKSDFCDPTDGQCADGPSQEIKVKVEACDGNDADDTQF